MVQTGNQAVAGTLSGSTVEQTSSSVGSFNTTNPYTGTCPGDLTVAVGDRSFLIPLSQTCSWIQVVGWVFVTAATLAGARIALT